MLQNERIEAKEIAQTYVIRKKIIIRLLLRLTPFLIRSELEECQVRSVIEHVSLFHHRRIENCTSTFYHFYFLLLKMSCWQDREPLIVRATTRSLSRLSEARGSVLHSRPFGTKAWRERDWSFDQYLFLHQTVNYFTLGISESVTKRTWLSVFRYVELLYISIE